jgi:PAS domain S-box-containing protein
LFNMSLLDVRAEGMRLVHETLLGEALMAGSLPAVVTDEGLHYLAVNEAACAFLGYTREQLLERSVPDVVVRPADDLVEETRQVFRAGSASGTAIVRRGDSSESAVEYVAFPTTVAGMSHVVSVWWTAASG